MPSDYTALIDATLGTGRGNCLIGPYRPHARVRLSPDCAAPHNDPSAYRQKQPVIGFSHTHTSGCGGPGRYGNIRIMPFCGKVKTNPIAPFFQAPFVRASDALLADERAAVGRYHAANPQLGVEIDLSTTDHVGVHRYRFDGRGDSWVGVDAGSCLSPASLLPGEQSLFQDWEQGPQSLGGYIEAIDERRLRGRSDFRGGWGNFAPYSIYFQIEADRPIRQIHFANSTGIVPGGVLKCVTGPGCLAFLDFGVEPEINLRVGISMASVANAEHFLRSESDGRDFDAVVHESQEVWNALFDRFRAEGDEPDRRLLYSLLYRMYCQPTDLGVDLENPYWKSGKRAFDDYTCLWDSIRNANAFYTLFDPDFSRDLLNNLIDIADHTGGRLPDAYASNHHTHMQSGCSALIAFSESARKGLDGIDYAHALELMRLDGESISPDPSLTGRHAEEWNRRGYVSTAVAKGCVSRHIEYAFYDWCTARLAEQLGETGVMDRYDAQSERLWNLWNPQTGFFQAKSPEGAFVPGGDPWVRSPESYNDALCYEAAPALWSFNAFQDFPGLIARHPSPEEFIRRLDHAFDTVWYPKETMMHLPHLYTVAGDADRAAERVHAILRRFYRLGCDGLPDDEDFGCQSGFFIWNAIGLYPVMGHTLYWLVPPIFRSVDFRTGPDTTLRIRCDVGDGGKYIKSLKIDGVPHPCAWLEHRQIADGALLEFELSDTPQHFGGGVRFPRMK